MGMYTEFCFAAELKPDTPESVLAVLRFMLGEIEEEPPLPAHPLFLTQRWDWMLRSDSYGFDADTHSVLRLEDVTDTYFLTIRCNLKNYDNEIEWFVDWITPYLKKFPGDFLGYQRYEGNEEPMLIYHEKGAILP